MAVVVFLYECVVIVSVMACGGGRECPAPSTDVERLTRAGQNPSEQLATMYIPAFSLVTLLQCTFPAFSLVAARAAVADRRTARAHWSMIRHQFLCANQRRAVPVAAER